MSKQVVCMLVVDVSRIIWRWGKVAVTVGELTTTAVLKLIGRVGSQAAK